MLARGWLGVVLWENRWRLVGFTSPEHLAILHTHFTAVEDLEYSEDEYDGALFVNSDCAFAIHTGLLVHFVQFFNSVGILNCMSSGWCLP